MRSVKVSLGDRTTHSAPAARTHMRPTERPLHNTLCADLSAKRMTAIVEECLFDSGARDVAVFRHDPPNSASIEFAP